MTTVLCTFLGGVFALAGVALGAYIVFALSAPRPPKPKAAAPLPEHYPMSPPPVGAPTTLLRGPGIPPPPENMNLDILPPSDAEAERSYRRTLERLHNRGEVLEVEPWMTQ